MPAPINWLSKILLAKIETTYGVDPAPAAANGILAKNVSYSPMEGDDVSRDLELPYFGGQAELPTGLRGTLTFETELAGSGVAGTAPAWGVLARACAMAQTVSAGVSVAYTPITDNLESCTIYAWIGGTRQIFKGCRGTAAIALDAQGIPAIRWTMTGLYAGPSEQARVTPTNLGSFISPAIATKANTPTFTVSGVALVLRSYQLTLANKVEPRLLIGSEGIIITGKDEEIAATVEAAPLTTLDPFALAAAQTSFATTLVHGTVAGNIATIAAATGRMKRMSGYEANQNVLEWPLRIKPLPNAGNDQFSITLT